MTHEDIRALVAQGLDLPECWLCCGAGLLGPCDNPHCVDGLQGRPEVVAMACLRGLSGVELTMAARADASHPFWASLEVTCSRRLTYGGGASYEEAIVAMWTRRQSAS